MNFHDKGDTAWGGRIYVVPFASGRQVLWYQKDPLSRAGLTPPETWDELLAAAKKLTRNGQYGIAIPAGKNYATDWYSSTFVLQAGTDLFDRNLEVIFGNPQSVEGIKFYTELLKYAPPGAGAYSWFEVIDAFTTKKAAMAIYHGRVLSRVYAHAPDLVGRFGAVPLPRGRVRVIFDDPNYYVINANTKHPKEAKEFLKFLITGEPAFKFLLSVPGHLPPATKEQKERLKGKTGNKMLDDNPEIAKVCFEVTEYAVFPPLHSGCIDQEKLKIVYTNIPNPYYATIWGGNNFTALAVQRVLLKGESPEEAVRWAAEQMRKAVAEAKAAEKK